MSEATQVPAATQARDATESKAESCLQLPKSGSTAKKQPFPKQAKDETAGGTMEAKVKTDKSSPHYAMKSEEPKSDTDSVIGFLGGNSVHGTIPFFGKSHTDLTDAEFTFAVSTSDDIRDGRHMGNGQPLATRSASIHSMGSALATSTGTPDDIEAEECKRLVHRTIFNFIESQDLISALLSAIYSKRPANSPVPGSEPPMLSPSVDARLRDVFTQSMFEIQEHYCRICNADTSGAHLRSHSLFLNDARNKRAKMLPYGQASLDAVVVRPNQSEQSLAEFDNHRQDLYKAVVERTMEFLKRNDLLDAVIMEIVRCLRYGTLGGIGAVIHRSPTQHTEIVQRMSPTLPVGWQTSSQERQDSGDRHSALRSSIGGRGRKLAASIQHRSEAR